MGRADSAYTHSHSMEAKAYCTKMPSQHQAGYLKPERSAPHAANSTPHFETSNQQPTAATCQLLLSQHNANTADIVSITLSLPLHDVPEQTTTQLSTLTCTQESSTHSLPFQHNTTMHDTTST